MAFNTIAFYPGKCNGCKDCERTCAYLHEKSVDPAHSRIRIVADTQAASYGIAQCRQCGDPRCVQDCPAKALTKNAATGIVLWDESRCVNCQLCTLACSYAGITFNPKTAKVMKCDQCAGDPGCVKACKPGALQYIKAAELFKQWGELEDLFVPGMSFCLGCNSELVVRHTLRRIGPNVVVATPPGCVAGVGAVGVNGRTATKTPVFHPLLTNTAAMLAGTRRYYNRIGRDVTMLAFAGDGGTADVGFQSLSGAAERGEQMIYLCIDNEGYMNTGVQRSSTTPYGAWTSTTPVGKALRGKTRDAKYLPIIMVMHNCAYVATASTAFMEDYYAKLDKAIAAAKTGMAYLHVFSPCPTGWRFPPEQLIEISRKAVETNMVPLWEFSAAEGGIRFTHPTDKPLPVREFLALIGKYRHLSDEQVTHIQAAMEQRLRMIKGFQKPEAAAAASTPGA
jgi:phenylglyoxylate dehydrogenase beta subunit